MNGRGRHPAAVWTDVRDCPVTPCPLCKAENYLATQGKVMNAEIDRRSKAEGDMKEAHAALTRSGVPEQIPPIKAPLAHVAYRILWLSARADRLEADLAAANEETMRVLSDLEATRAAYNQHLDSEKARADRLMALIVRWADDKRTWPGAPVMTYDVPLLNVAKEKK